MPKVSVVVAAYNVEDYIEEALHSLINQTLEDVEFIVVDDGSTDDTGKIIKQWAEMDKRINLVTHEKNKGLMLARKTGYDIATGEYIMFLDGDDYLAFNACEKAYNAIKKSNVDILQFGTQVFYDDNYTESNPVELNNMQSYFVSLNSKIFAPGKAGLLGARHSKDALGLTIWNKIYKKSLVDKVSQYIPDEHIVMSEDVLFSYLACFLAKSYNCINTKLYNYRFGNGISTTKKMSDFKMNSVVKCYYVYKYLSDWTEKQNATKICKNRLNTLKMQALKAIGYAFLVQISADKRNYFANKVSEICPLEDFISMLSYMTLYENCVKPHELAQYCAGLDIFKTTKKEKKTIGTYYFRAYNGGVENVISQLTDIWTKLGYDVVLFTDQQKNDDDYYINPKVKRVILPEYVYGKYPTYFKRTEFFRNALKKHNVDIMVYHAWIYDHLAADALIAKSLGIPFIVHTHGVFCSDVVAIDGGSAYYNANLHKVFSISDSIIVLNETDQAYWNSFGLNIIKTINPTALPLSTTVSPLNGKNIVTVSRISHEKQIMDTIKIVHKVTEKISDVVLTIVGSGDEYEKNRLTNYINDNKLDKVVKLVGFKKNVVPYYQSADIMLFTSKFEGAPLSLMESKICGLPLVTYELLNVDTVRDAKGMAVVPQNDIDAAAEEIIKILSDDKLKKQMGKEARESAEEMLSIDLAKHWDYIFEKTLNPDTKEIKLTPDQSALNTLVHYTSQGILARMYTHPQVQYQQIPLEVPNEDWLLQSHYAESLEATIKEIRSSTSYRLGWFLTTIPRKIKDFIKGQKYVE
ncbi:MAG: glycosyltransferase [Clostridia bacterium]|nr:glycosyltransferase [Clostridia bacterium]